MLNLAGSVGSSGGSLAGATVLDLGCGTGYYAEIFSRLGASVLGVDASEAMLVELKNKGLNGLRSEIAELQLNGKFDLIIAAGVSEFMPDVGALFRVARAHCRLEGQFLLLAPRGGLIGWAYDFVHAFQGCKTRTHSLQQLAQAAERYGWVRAEIRGAGPLARVFRFVPMEVHA